MRLTYNTAQNCLNYEDIHRFMVAGNACFTIENTLTGNRATFKMRTPKKMRSQANPPIFVSLFCGTENDNAQHYRFFGTVFGKTTFRLSPKAKVSPNVMGVQAFEWLWNHLQNNKPLPNCVKVWHEGRCGCCGKKLTVPESIKSGLGPYCGGRS